MTAGALLIQPWIHDFAAYDLWIKPIGLLQIGQILRLSGIHVDFIDCLDSSYAPQENKPVKRKPNGSGKFHKEEIIKPDALAWFPRRYNRYGIPPSEFLERLKGAPKPDVILMTSGMTYWYPGVQEAVKCCREVYPEVPIILGGTYATLCYDHARRFSGADLVVRSGDWSSIIRALSSYLPVSRELQNHLIIPAWDLMPTTQAIAVRTSTGCPFHCSYCAARRLSGGYTARDPIDVVREIRWAIERTGANDVAFYDDALLWRAGTRLGSILEGLARERILPRFHCPNGLHARFVRPEIARMMFSSGFKTIRLGLESASSAFHQKMGRKLGIGEFRSAALALCSAGYHGHEIGAYVLVGLPGQRIDEVRQTIDYVVEAGVRPYLAEYSPIPGTALWENAVRSSPFPLEEEPLYQNNTILPCRSSDLSYEDLNRLKSYIKRPWTDMVAR